MLNNIKLYKYDKNYIFIENIYFIKIYFINNIMSQIPITYYDLFCEDDNIKSSISTYRLLNIDDKNTDCPITLDKINLMDKYCKCSNCNYNFDYDCLLKHLDIKNNCPMCRFEWTCNEIYINFDKNTVDKNTKKDLYMFNKLSNKYKNIKRNKILFS
jgi:hypothetical protein